MNKQDWIMIAAVVLLMVLFVWAFVSAGAAENEHSRQQVEECRRLGGFAQTSEGGWMRGCTFPYGGR